MVAAIMRQCPAFKWRPAALKGGQACWGTWTKLRAACDSGMRTTPPKRRYRI